MRLLMPRESEWQWQCQRHTAGVSAETERSKHWEERRASHTDRPRHTNQVSWQGPESAP